MKATIERATLLKSLGHVQSVVERRNTIPILSNVLIEANSDGTIRLMATDGGTQGVEGADARAIERQRSPAITGHVHAECACRGVKAQAVQAYRQIDDVRRAGWRPGKDDAIAVGGQTPRAPVAGRAPVGRPTSPRPDQYRAGP